jgi:hypothetical protein
MSNRPDPRQYLRGFKEPYVRPVVPPMHASPAPLAEQQYIGGMQQWERRSVLGNNIPDHVNQMALLDERIELERRERERLEQERIGKEMHFMVESMVETATGGASTGDGGGPAIKKSGPTLTDADVRTYYNAIVAAGGGISNNNILAIQTAVTTMKNTNDSTDGNSLWSHFQQAFFFVGQNSLTNGLYIPIVNTLNGTVVSNGNFTYSKTQGVIQDGVSSDGYLSGTAYVDTGIANNNTSFPANNRHAYAYISGFKGNTVTNIGPVYGEDNIVANRSYQFLPSYSSTFSRYDCLAYNNNAGGHATVIGLAPPPVVGGYGVYNSSPGSNVPYKFGTGRTTLLTPGTSFASGNTSNNILIGKGGNTGNGIGGNIYSFFSLGSKFGSSTSLDTMDTIISTLLTSLI